MKPTSHEPLDDQIAAALHGDLSPQERAQFETRLQNDPNAAAAYKEAQAMHDLLEKTNRAAQPDPGFEQRMISGVRRKLAQPAHRETAWESALLLWKGLTWTLNSRWKYAIGGGLMTVFLALAMAYYHDTGVLRTLGNNGIANPGRVEDFTRTYLPASVYGLSLAKENEARAQAMQMQVDDLKSVINKQGIKYAETAQKGVTLSGYVDTGYTQAFGGRAITFGNAAEVKAGAGSLTLGNARAHGPTVVGSGTLAGSITPSIDVNGGALTSRGNIMAGSGQMTLSGANTYTGGTTINSDSGQTTITSGSSVSFAQNYGASRPASGKPSTEEAAKAKMLAPDGIAALKDVDEAQKNVADGNTRTPALPAAPMAPPKPRESVHLEWNEAIAPGTASPVESTAANKPTEIAQYQRRSESASENQATAWDASGKKPTQSTTAPAAVDDRKLIRNAQLDLEVKSFQAAFDQVTVLTRTAGGYVDTSSSQRGGNGKLQGTIVVKILPPQLDAFLLKLRDLGEVQNQQVSTDDVTKAYFDTQARLGNSQKMEEQLQELLKRENGKVSDLLAVERELGRVRGEIEQMQGQLKLYDFQVQYATVTMQIAEKDLNQAAAYVLKEQDDFALFATDVEATFQKARQSADDFKTQVLVANLEHNSGSDVSAELTVMVAPDQVEHFLSAVRGLGRVSNFTRQTQRVAKDGGDSDQPADETLTEKDKVQVHLTIKSDDESRKQVAVTVVAKAVDEALDQAKAAALANTGTEILSSSLNKSPEGESTARLSVRVPGKEYGTLMDAFRAIGRQASLSVQRNDNSGPGASGDDVPVIVSLSLTDNDAPVQVSDLAIAADDVDAQSQQIKRAAGDAGVEIKASSFQRQPDGTELAQMTLVMPLGKYTGFLTTVEKAGKVESLSVQRDDRPDQSRADNAAPVQINLQLHNERAIIADNEGLWPTMRRTFGEGFAALFGSVRVIGVLLAFVAPWLVTVLLFAWIGRRIYVWRKNR